MKKLILFLCLIVPVFVVFAYDFYGKRKTTSHRPQAQWSKADSTDVYYPQWDRAKKLLGGQKPKSAAALIDSIYAIAKADNDRVIMLKSQLYYLEIINDTSENANRDEITFAEARAKDAEYPYKAIWQSIEAQLYWKYYQANRYKILERTKIDGPAPEDFEQWGADLFFGKARSLYLQSLSHARELKETDIRGLAPVLTVGDSTEYLRPTLYDLLAFRAIGYFENEEKDVTRPAFAFVMEDEAAFAPAEKFAGHQFTTTDTLSLQWKALQLFQQVLSMHLQDGNENAVMDADLLRLQFVYKHSVSANKKSLYVEALRAVADKYSHNSMSAIALYKVVELTGGFTEGYRNLYGNEGYDLDDKKEKIDYPKFVSMLQNIVATYPGSEGAEMATSLIAAITKKDISFETEDVVLPGEPSKILLSYRNVNKAFIKVVKIEDPEYMARRDLPRIKVEYMNLNPVLKFNLALPGTEDYYKHSTEVKIDALPPGAYCIYISCEDGFPIDSNLIVWQYFQVSRLGYISENRYSGLDYVIDRQSGEPVEGAAVIFNSKNNTGDASTHTAADGSFSLSVPQDKYVTGNLLIIHKGDSLYSKYNRNGFQKTEEKPEDKTFFFTDRAIYRPGQTIYFKGIITNIENGGRKAKILANKKTEVTVSDANSQEIAKLELISNEYGSFTGTFQIPDGLMPGEFTIENETGETTIQVEEYKRPKFQVIFDTLKKAIALNEKITVTGSADAFAGSNIDGAAVKYKVSRKARWNYANNNPYIPEMEMTNGTTKTDENGKFEIAFTALPDLTVDKKTMPVFSYKIEADITDVNGETHSESKTVDVGYVSVKIDDDIPALAGPKQLNTLSIRTETLDGAFMPGDVAVRISKLKEPGKIYRKRYWQVPDQFVMDEKTFRKNFPLDEYKEEGNYKTWPVSASVYNETVTTQRNGAVPIPENTWRQNGWYVVEISTKDKNGIEVKDRKYVEVWDKENQGKVDEPLLVMPGSLVAAPGDQPELTIYSCFDRCLILKQEQVANSQPKTERQSYDDKPMLWKRPVTEADRGGIELYYTIIKDNRIYSKQVAVKVPWTNKQLHLHWETHRDKLQPGAKETWTVTIKGDNREKVAAEMLATLYDASLDQFAEQEWAIDGLYPATPSYLFWNNDMGHKASWFLNNIDHDNMPFDRHAGRGSYQDLIIVGEMSSYPRHMTYAWGNQRNSYRGNGDSMMDSGVIADPVTGGLPAAYSSVAYNKAAYIVDGVQIQTMPTTEVTDMVSMAAGVDGSKGVSRAVPLRKNLRETAFFYPQLRTDDSGNVRFQFTMPEALTEWKFMALAHTKDMALGRTGGVVKTQKDLMVYPNLPRFFRQGDDMEITTKISDLSAKDEQGTARIQILDAATLKPLNTLFTIARPDVDFKVKNGQSTTASWKIHVPENLFEPVVVRISAATTDFTDGEENTLPVISNRMMVTETMPLWVNGNNEKSFHLDKLLHSDTSKTLSQYGLTVEYTSNPAWYAILALPYLMEFPHECAEQTFNRYYANALAARVANVSPRAEAIFSKWQKEDTAVLLSNLEKNPELKSALLQETPWVMEAKNETEQRHRIAMLFQASKLSASQHAAAQKLRDMQMGAGGFPWFKGSNDADRYITQYIVTGIGRLKHLGVKIEDDEINSVVKYGIPYLDKQMKADFDNLKTIKADLSRQQIGNSEIQYLYMRSFFKDVPVSKDCQDAYNYYINQAVVYQSSFNSYMRGMIALALYREGDKKTPVEIISSLKETAHHSGEMGMYWSTGGSYWWYEAPIEEQALLIECFSEVANDIASIDAMKLWLLKQKQTQNWHTTKATADACYALLLNGSQWLNNDPEVTIKLGSETIKSTDLKQQKGTGYFKVRYDAGKVKPKMGDIKVSVTGNEHSTSWGAAYWQYFENLDKISGATTSIVVKKNFYITRNGDRGSELQPITEKNTLKIGDKVTVRIEIIADRDMDYVQLKDMRPACFEPVNVISEYKYQGGLGYYEATKDASSNFFISHLGKGKYVFEYPVFVTHSGDFSSGIATLQCMYAPEFSSHSAGVRLHVVGGK